MLTIDDITTELDEMAEQAEVIVEMLYDLAKSGRWDKVLRAFDEEPRVAAKCSRPNKPSLASSAQRRP